MAREGSKTARAIAVMTANANLPMEDVLPLIAEATGHDLPHARNYYVWCVRKGVAPGVVPVKARKAAAPKAPKAAKVAAPKAAKPKKETAAPKVESKTPDEIERIKAANLARMKQIGSKMAKRKEETGEEPIQRSTAELDSFAAPAFLTKRDVEALV